MGKPGKQLEATNHIKELLNKGGVSIDPRKMALEGNRQWVVFEYENRQIGIDSASGVWVRESPVDDWRCVATPCNVSGALQAVEFLIAG